MSITLTPRNPQVILDIVPDPAITQHVTLLVSAADARYIDDHLPFDAIIDIPGEGIWLGSILDTEVESTNPNPSIYVRLT